jgi:hypothetical protein
MVVDATGVGERIADLLADQLRSRRPGQTSIYVEPFKFTSASASELGYRLLGIVDSGRFKDYAPADELQRAFLAECAACLYEFAGANPNQPGRLMRWGVPSLGHDDLLLSLALVAHLDTLDLRDRQAIGRG